jgi:MFS family permease
MLKAVPGNAGVLVVTEGLASIPFGWYATYLPLYMLALGVSEVQIGLFASVAAATQFLSTLVGGYAADRFGRKRTLVIGDIICWVIPVFLYTVARNPWYFLVGQLFNGFVYLVIPAFECLFVEDVSEDRHPAVFGALRLAYALASLFTPIAGLLVVRMGLVDAGRAIMASTTVTALLTALSRQLTMRETARGRERMASTAGISPLEASRSYFAAVAGIFRSRETTRFLTVRMLGAFSGTVWNTYAAIFLTDRLGIGLPSASISLLPVVASVTTILVIVTAAGRIHRGSLRTNLILGQIIWLGSAVLVALSPRGTIVLALLSTVLAAVSTAFFQPASQSYWAKVVDEKTRAQAFSAASAVVVLCTLPAGSLAGLLYTLSPRAPFFLGIALQLVVLALIVALRPIAAPSGKEAPPSSPVAG